MFYIVFDFMMAVIMFLFGMWFYKSEGKATKFLSGYNMKSADERKKYDENAMCKAYGKRMMFMSVPFIIGIIIDIQYQGIGCWIAWGIWLIMFAVKKSYAPQAGYSGYECELSIHLATAYISFAPVRVLRTGAFCFFQLFSEKRTQEPSPERVRSERGREDKPLTPVLYSTREGGELYGKEFNRNTEC